MSEHGVYFRKQWLREAQDRFKKNGRIKWYIKPTMWKEEEANTIELSILSKVGRVVVHSGGRDSQISEFEASLFFHCEGGFQRSNSGF